MNEKLNLTSNENPGYLWRFLAATLIWLYIGTMIVLYRSDLKAAYEPPLLLLITKTLFAGLLPVAVSIIATRSYLFSGMNSLFLMGCGMLTLGCRAALAGWLVDGQQVPNVNVTIMNGAFLSSAFHAVGAILALKKSTLETKPELRKFHVILTNAAMFLVVLGCNLATRRGMRSILQSISDLFLGIILTHFSMAIAELQKRCRHSLQSTSCKRESACDD